MFVYLLVRRVLGLAVLVFRRDLAKDAELLVLRHENAVLRLAGTPGGYGTAVHLRVERHDNRLVMIGWPLERCSCHYTGFARTRPIAPAVRQSPIIRSARPSVRA